MLNVKIFVVSEVFILILALVIAVVRGIPGPVFFPFRLVAVAYTDLFRGVPLILVLYMIGFGVPGLGLGFVSYLPDVTYGIIALVLVYSAYVAEVYRAGIESVHESQNAAARSLGLSRWQSLRFVVLPQAIRRVIPPLLNDFIGLAEGHGARLGARLHRGGAGRPDLRRLPVQLRELRGRGPPLRPHHHPPRPLHGPPDRARQTPPPGRGPRVSEASALLVLEGVRKSFGENEVLKGIDLSVAPHEVVCLIGASGSGKSTLLRCVNLVEPIDSGRVVVEGEEITAPGVDANRIRRRIGIVYQSFNLFPHMTVLRNITLAPREALKMDREAAEKQAHSLLERFGLSDKRDEYPDRLSGGQQQRVAIVRALAMRPPSCSSTRSRAPSTPSSSPRSSPSSASSPTRG